LYYPYGLAYDPSSSRLFVADAGNNRVLQYSFIRLTTNALPDGTAGSAYSSSLVTTSTQGTVSFALDSGNLPTGLSLATSTGVISGTPTDATSSSFTIEADDSFTTGMFSDAEPFTLTISAAPAPIPTFIVDVPAGGPLIVHPAPAPPTETSSPTLPVISPTLPSSSVSSLTSSSSLETELASLEAQLNALLEEASTGSSASPSLPFSPSSLSPSFPHNLSLWMTGSDVHALQVFLNTHGFPVAKTGNGSAGHETDTFGPKTYDALVQFQNANHIPATGFFGPMTRAIIDDQ